MIPDSSDMRTNAELSTHSQYFETINKQTAM
ncbi:unnamed protein product [Callosobruchus maculatus]|uniref:Uncharacterized protein n=1 Tax=Callosobruchus maculatus TaxID=64391 RepID=A0A653C547_CALMS|nr:unnamed protein product [Callosobruchus maculatus]